MPNAHLHGLGIDQVVALLDRRVVGQVAAKRCLATALVRRLRQRELPPEARGRLDHVLLTGPVGVGRSAIARRAAAVANAPFLKLDAGRLLAAPFDGEHLLRELVEVAARLYGDQAREHAQRQALAQAEERMLDALLPKRRGPGFAIDISMDGDETRNRLRAQLQAGELDGREVEIDLPARAHGEGVGTDANRQRRSIAIAELRPLLVEEQLAALVDEAQTQREALENCEQNGIVLVADLDRLVLRGDGDDVRREAAQRELLSLLEGRTLATRLGALRTGQLLFVGVGAFQSVRPGELLPELQGRFSARAALLPLTPAELREVLAREDGGLLARYQALFASAGGALDIGADAIDRLLAIATAMNVRAGDIGAHRLPPLLAQLFDGVDGATAVRIDRARVDAVLGALLEDPAQGHLLL